MPLAAAPKLHHYQIASPDRYTCTAAARCQPEVVRAPAHDAFTRLLQRQPGDTAELWQEAQPWVPRAGCLVDDTTLDKPYAREIEHVALEWQTGCPQGAAGHQPGLPGLERRCGPHSL